MFNWHGWYVLNAHLEVYWELISIHSDVSPCQSTCWRAYVMTLYVAIMLGWVCVISRWCVSDIKRVSLIWYQNMKFISGTTWGISRLSKWHLTVVPWCCGAQPLRPLIEPHQRISHLLNPTSFNSPLQDRERHCIYKRPVGTLMAIDNQIHDQTSQGIFICRRTQKHSWAHDHS